MPLKSPKLFYCNACLFGYAGVGKMQIQTKGKIGKRTLGVSKKAADVAAKAGKTFKVLNLEGYIRDYKKIVPFIVRSLSCLNSSKREEVGWE